MNVRADFASRNWNDYSDWMLDPAIFMQLQRRFGPFSIDLFASYQNAQIPQFYSWKPSPNALAVDALAQHWNHFSLPYAFPPFALIGRCLQKIIKDKVPHVLIIAPVWPAQHWYPLMLQMLSDYPLLLPSQMDLIRNPHSQCHPLIQERHMRLGAWPVSGVHCQVANFQKTLSQSTVHLGESQQQNHTILHGTSGYAGVNEGRLIPFQHL